MTVDARHETPLPDWQQMTDVQRDRWATVLGTLAATVPAGAVGLVIDGRDAAAVADRLAETLLSAGRPCIRLTDATPLADEDRWFIERTPSTVALADGPRWRAEPPAAAWDLVIWLRTREPQPRQETSDDADIVVDLADPAWPIIRRIHRRVATPDHWYVTESQAFFALRAATWDTKFGDDLPAYAAAVAQLDPPPGGTALDLGCGTGRALPALRKAVGPAGSVIALDLTPDMLRAARAADRAHHAALILADAHHLPLADATVHTVFAAGLLNHLHDLHTGLRELTRVTRPAARLAIFHPSGRAALAARHGRTLRPDEPLSEQRLRHSLNATGWALTGYDDSPHRFFALAIRSM
jgi:SAM-dependent methyltransferase